MVEEEWRTIAQCGWIQVSSLGRVRSWRNGRYGLRSEPRMVEPSPDSTGYRTFGVRPETGKALKVRVHRLVCEAFHGPAPFPGAVARHLNGNPLDNRRENLAWGSRQDNSDDMVSHGRAPRGARQPDVKLTEDTVREMRRLYFSGSLSQRAIGDRFGISRRHVSAVVRGERWGYVA